MPTILVVDDEDDIRSFIQAALEERGYRVLATGDPQHALRIATQEPIHLLLTDVVMPLMKGTELAAYTLLEATASGYTNLAKPFRADTPAERVQHVLDQPSPFARPRPQREPSDG